MVRISSARQFTLSTIRFKKSADNIKGKSSGSQKWITRQINDPYVAKAKEENYRCRSAFKLIEINERFNILKPGFTVVDCGAAPGSWMQVSVRSVNSLNKDTNERIGKVIGVDLLGIHRLQGAHCLGLRDFTKKETQDEIFELLDGQLVNVVLSDMAPNASGIKSIDHEGIMDLCYSALKFAVLVLKPGGSFLCKIWQGPEQSDFESILQECFKTVNVVKPLASRKDSAEAFLLGRTFVKPE